MTRLGGSRVTLSEDILFERTRISTYFLREEKNTNLVRKQWVYFFITTRSGQHILYLVFGQRVALWRALLKVARGYAARTLFFWNEVFLNIPPSLASKKIWYAGVKGVQIDSCNFGGDKHISLNDVLWYPSFATSNGPISLRDLHKCGFIVNHGWSSVRTRLCCLLSVLRKTHEKNGNSRVPLPTAKCSKIFQILQGIKFGNKIGHIIMLHCVPGHCGVQSIVDADHLASLGHGFHEVTQTKEFQELPLYRVPLTPSSIGCLLELHTRRRFCTGSIVYPLLAVHQGRQSRTLIISCFTVCV